MQTPRINTSLDNIYYPTSGISDEIKAQSQLRQRIEQEVGDRAS